MTLKHLVLLAACSTQTEASEQVFSFFFTPRVKVELAAIRWQQDMKNEKDKLP